MEFIELYKQTQHLNILFVEDDKSFRLETTDLLIQLFKSVKVAHNGEEALKTYEEYTQENKEYFDIVISDIKMPYLDGIGLTKKIYELNELQNIIILSAHNESEYLIELINIGIAQFLMKPLNMDELFIVLYNLASKINSSKENSDELVENKSDATNIILPNNYIWNTTTLTLTHNDELIKLSHYERSLFDLLVQNGPKVSTFQEILNIVWQDKQNEVFNDVIKATIHRIRQKTSGLKIENISKLGYRIIF